MFFNIFDWGNDVVFILGWFSLFGKFEEIFNDFWVFVKDFFCYVWFKVFDIFCYGWFKVFSN